MYPKVLRCEEFDADGLAMEQELIGWPNLRAHIQCEGTDLYEIIQRLRFLLHQLKQHSYDNAAQPAPPDYVDRLHFRRVRERIAMTCELCSSFQAIVAAKEVVINGVAFANIEEILNRLESSRAIRALVTPPRVGPYAHGDLHFENILFDPATLGVKLVDPRGYPLCDIYYDLGKLSHSTHGKYDLIHEGRFALLHTSEAGRIRATVTFPDRALVRAYDQINSHLRNWCYELTGDDEWAVARMLFNEAMHFCADMPFHLNGDGEQAKSIAIYLTGVRLLNQFVADWNC
jgi:hypothetical protein